MHSISKYVWAIALALFMQSASGARLGAIQVYSSPGEPLDAEIELLSAAGLETLAARIASPDEYKASGIKYNLRLAQARIVPKRGRDGRLYLRATTLAALDDSALEMLIEVTTARERYSAHYTVGMNSQDRRPVSALPNAATPPQRQQSLKIAQEEPIRPVKTEPLKLAAPTVPGAVVPRENERVIGRHVPPAATPERLPELRGALPGPATPLPRAASPGAGERPPPGRMRVLQMPQTPVRPTLDGALDDAAWKNAVIADRFWVSEQQRWPSEQTEVLVMADREYLYFGFRVYDSQPKGINAIQTRRGAGLGLDDQISVELDPFLSYREISSYSVSANGVQDDAMAGGRARQLAWKGDWQAAAVRTIFGWSAEIAIPFSILNFEEGRTTIGANFVRYHHRTTEWSRWADVSVRSLPEEMGRLTGLQFPTTAKVQPWTFMPYIVAGRHVRDKRGNPQETLLNAGTEIRYQPRPNLTGVLSINPDFSQVESAITNINFNYNEKFRADPRPFFQEGSAYFGTNRGYFYSNRIPDFDYGAKFFTRAGGYQVGALATRAPRERSDFVVRAERELDATHSIGGLVVATDSENLRNRLYAVRGQGREPSGLNYALDAAMTTTEDRPGDGSRVAGSIGWARDYWSVSATADRHSINYRPANGLLDRDLPDTHGMTGTVSYYRDFGAGPVREINASVSGHGRDTEDGRRQRRTWTAGGTVEARQQVRLGLFYTEGTYRPVGTKPGSWSSTINEDYFWTGSLDFNTRSSRIGYGVAHSSGFLGGDDYDYTSVYAWVRPTTSTFINVASERLSNFGKFQQDIVSAGWDISRLHGIVGRYITADYGKAYRLAYSLHVRRNVDFFLVYDREPEQLAKISAKIVMTLQ